MKKMMTVLLLVFAVIFQLSANENWFAAKFPAKLIDKSGREVDAATALKGKMVAVYFSASWCPPCRKFTPELVKFYNKVNKADIELIFVSSDRSSEDMLGYMNKYSMPWLCLPFDAPQKAALKKELKITGIPTLVVFGKDGKLITRSARGDVMRSGAKAIDAWKNPKKFKSGTKTKKKSKRR